LQRRGQFDVAALHDPEGEVVEVAVGFLIAIAETAYKTE
jgi:hypothetical protein